MELINLKKYSKSISNTKYLTHEEVFEIKEETKYLECIYLIF